MNEAILDRLTDAIARLESVVTGPLTKFGDKLENSAEWLWAAANLFRNSMDRCGMFFVTGCLILGVCFFAGMRWRRVG